MALIPPVPTRQQIITELKAHCGQHGNVSLTEYVAARFPGSILPDRSTMISLAREAGLEPTDNPDVWRFPVVLQAVPISATSGTLSLDTMQAAYMTTLANWQFTGDGTGAVPSAPPKPAAPVPPPPPKVTLASVVLSDDKKEEIQAAMAQIHHSKLIFDEWGFGDTFEKGTAITLLFHGIPGTGKTLMAQAIAEELHAELKIYGTAEIQSSEPGGAERTIKKIFTDARDFFALKKKQRVILFDECDSLLYDRNKVGVIMGAQINQMLTEIEHHDGIVIFTTNRIGKLDAALERRIAAKIEFPFPDAKQREAIWKRMIPTKAPIHKDVHFGKLARHPIAGGNIKNAVLNAARVAAYKKSDSITMAHFEQAVQREKAASIAFQTKDTQAVVSDEIGMQEDTTLAVKTSIGRAA